MKLLLDQGLPRTTAAILRGEGVDATHTGEIGMSTAEDAEIIERAKNENRIVVTLDADFHALVALSGDLSPSVIRIRIERLRAEKLAELLGVILNQCCQDLQSGALMTVYPHRLKLRRLPITR